MRFEEAKEEVVRTVLTIAGLDPSNGAGVTADLAVMAALGCFGTCCVTALTVQSTVGVRGVEVVEARMVRETLACLKEDLPAAGVKIGMLGSAGNVEAVAEFLEVRGRVPVVLDPVLRSSSGRALLEMRGVEAMRKRLLGVVDWVTPNTAELAVLTGERVESRADVERAAARLAEGWPGLGVVATGGHLAEPDDLMVWPDGRMVWLQGERVESAATHGTGCAFSTAMLCGLVNGLDGDEAARRAKTFVVEAVRRAERRGSGRGPMELYWPLRGES